MEKEILTEAGLTQNEAEIYYILLKLKEAPASEIAVKTRISRPHIYDSLNKLIEKGIANYVVKNGKRYFKPSNPEKLLDNLRDKEKNLEKILPDLKNLFKPIYEKPFVEIYEGPEGIKTILNDMIRTGKEMISFNTLGEEFYKYVPEYIISRYLKEREKRKIKSRQFYVEGARILKHPMATYKKISQDYNPVTLFVYGNNIVMFILSDTPLAIKIKDEQTAKLYKDRFELLWKQAKS
ncbi:hypothetical protein GF386_04135 [Candidatus Pacearchaeota archaeon]|nr:hypothetical protein [Candidatus Pacearchaeota archaeon]MBD3283317.1 hypothetical protein [Candidatus Pacearchaeota archaeon]